jgi:hypothetical protein
MKERGNYRTMGKAARLYIKKIRGGRTDHGDRSLVVMIILITSRLGRVLWARGSADGLRSWVTTVTRSPARLVL